MGLQSFQGCSIALVLMACPLLADETFPVLTVGSETYSNVVITGKNKKTVFIQHEHGIATLKAKDLSFEVAKQLGFETEAPQPKKVPLAERIQVDPRMREWQAQATEQLKASLDRTRPTQIGLILGGTLLVYLFFCQCCRLICLKTGHNPGVLIWFPVLKWVPLLKAASMSGWCFLLFFLPIVNLIAGVVWCVKICSARQKSPILVLFLLLPVTNVLAFLYLAFSAGLEIEEAPQRLQFS